MVCKVLGIPLIDGVGMYTTLDLQSAGLEKPLTSAMAGHMYASVHLVSYILVVTSNNTKGFTPHCVTIILVPVLGHRTQYMQYVASYCSQ